jgi:glucose-1-phosphate thymidylyltransferase
MTTKAVILARGLGKRMRQADAGAAIDAQQAAVADQGVKAMIPIGRPFLDYVLSALADAGCDDVCLVIGPEHNAVREYYEQSGLLHRVRVTFAIQERPVGTANAVLAAEAFAGSDRFLVMNADNYYPPESYVALRTLGESGLIAFDRDALVADGHVPPDRILNFALLDIDAHGYLRRIVEKPDDATARAMTVAGRARVSMNIWCFDSGIFDPCRTVAPSTRGELELPVAVQHAIDAYGRRFRAVPMSAPVLDLSSRADIAGVTERLRGVDVRL